MAFFDFLKKNKHIKPKELSQEEKIRQLLKKVNQVEIHSHQVADKMLSGQYHSIFKGQGLEFDRVREYVPGDDVRAIDWNVTARTGKPHIKLFVEERELNIIIALDISPSNDFGSQEKSKRYYATEIAATLAFSAIKNNDKLGLVLFSDKIEHFLPPKAGKPNLSRIIRDSLFIKPESSASNPISVINFVNRVIKNNAIIFLISDFQFTNANENSYQLFSKKLQATSKHHDIFPILIQDVRESLIPNIGIISLQDSETGETFTINTNDSQNNKRIYDLEKQRVQSIKKYLNKSNLDFIELTVGMPYISALKNSFSIRQKKIS